jgi:hypothetical protein
MRLQISTNQQTCRDAQAARQLGACENHDYVIPCIAANEKKKINDEKHRREKDGRLLGYKIGGGYVENVLVEPSRDTEL